MPLISSKELLLKAHRGHFGIGAFNVNNMEMVQAVIEAAEEEKAPVILQVSQGALKYAGLEFAANLVKTGAELASVPVVLHLDHGTDFHQNVRCLRAGFTSLMYDGTERMLDAYKKLSGDNKPSFEVIYKNVQSQEAFEENVRITKMIVDMAHACDVPVEAELGKIPRIDDFWEIIGKNFNYSARLPESVQKMVEKLFVDPMNAEEFVQLTGCDSLAVACGSIHGMKAGTQPLNIQLLDEISSRTNIPLVLHGSSGVIKTMKDAEASGIRPGKNEGTIEDALRYGISKINVSTELQITFVDMVRKEMENNPGEKDVRKIFLPAKTALKSRVRCLIRLFGSSGKGHTGFVSKLGKSEIMHPE